MSNSVRPYGQQPTRLCHPQDSLGKNTGVGCQFLLHTNRLVSKSKKSLSRAQLFVTPQTVAYQAPQFIQRCGQVGGGLPQWPLLASGWRPEPCRGLAAGSGAQRCPWQADLGGADGDEALSCVPRPRHACVRCRCAGCWGCGGAGGLVPVPSALAGTFFTTEPPGKPFFMVSNCFLFCIPLFLAPTAMEICRIQIEGLPV